MLVTQPYALSRVPVLCHELVRMCVCVCVQGSSTLEGVELGQFIIKTHHGRIFRGVYNGEAVTVKVGRSLSLCLLCFFACRGSASCGTERQNMEFSGQHCSWTWDMHIRVNIVWKPGTYQCVEERQHCRQQ